MDNNGIIDGDTIYSIPKIMGLTGSAVVIATLLGSRALMMTNPPVAALSIIGSMALSGLWAKYRNNWNNYRYSGANDERSKLNEKFEFTKDDKTRLSYSSNGGNSCESIFSEELRILGLPTNSNVSYSEIKQAFTDLAQEHHPDHNTDKKKQKKNSS